MAKKSTVTSSTESTATAVVTPSITHQQQRASAPLKASAPGSNGAAQNSRTNTQGNGAAQISRTDTEVNGAAQISRTDTQGTYAFYCVD